MNSYLFGATVLLLVAACQAPQERGAAVSPLDKPLPAASSSSAVVPKAPNTSATSGAPVTTPAAVRVRQVSTSNEVCALTEDGAVWCWGLDSGPVPVKVALPLRAEAVEPGFGTNCALLVDHSVWCWGGRLGTPALRFSNAKKLVQSTPEHCTLSLDGKLACLGYQLWLERIHAPHRKDTGGPVVLPIPFPVIDAYVHPDQGCALGAKKQLQCWGNLWRFDRYEPPAGAVRIEGGGMSLCVLDSAGAVRNFAANEPSRIVVAGAPKEWLERARILSENVADMSCDGTDSCTDCTGCAVHRDGRFTCWSSESSFRADHMSASNLLTVPPLPPVAAVSVGHGYLCVISTARELLCWGANAEGHLGRGTRTEWEAEPRPPAWPDAARLRTTESAAPDR